VIDWLTVHIFCDHEPIPSGRVLCITAEGETSWEKSTGAEAVGSFDAKLRISSIPGPNLLEAGEQLVCTYALRIDGNLTKYLQGHGLFGIEDARQLVRKTLLKLGDRIAWKGQPLDCIGSAKVLRIDVTRNFRVGSDADALQWIRAVGSATTMAQRGRGSFAHDTLYWGKNSRRWSLKCYSKGPEFLRCDAKRLKLHLPEKRIDQLVSYARGLIRFEAVYRSLELTHRNINTIDALTPAVAADLWTSAMSALKFPSSEQFIPNLAHLPPRLLAPATLWLTGKDLRAVYSRPTYFRHKRALLAHGINVDVERSDTLDSNVIPFLRPLEAKPVGVPAWAARTALAAAC
jgi:II/X family phage/plasmid replication protein